MLPGKKGIMLTPEQFKAVLSVQSEVEELLGEV
jgi:Transcriptional Coactivator p15 (PC4)